MPDFLRDHIVEKAQRLYRKMTSLKPHTKPGRRANYHGGTNSEIYRVTDGEWSVILKITGNPDATLGDAGDWRREIDAYKSGDLKRLPPGLRAAECYEMKINRTARHFCGLKIFMSRSPNGQLKTITVRRARSADLTGRISLAGPDLMARGSVNPGCEHRWKRARTIWRLWLPMPIMI